MQSYKYDKAIAPESKNGGSPALNNNPAKGSSKKVLLICLDFLCLVMGELPRSCSVPLLPSFLSSLRVSRSGSLWGEPDRAAPRTKGARSGAGEPSPLGAAPRLTA